MRSIFAILLLWAVISSCNFTEKKDKGGAKTYSYDCLDSALNGKEANKIIRKGGEIIRDFAIDEATITDDVQNEYGAMFHADALQSNTFKLSADKELEALLQKTLDDLLEVRENPSSIKYIIYALEDSVVNAFTFGGRIYVTKGMYRRCASRPALLYAIIGHEIGHSERGHIKRTIQEMKLSQKIFGEKNGMTAFQIQRLLTASFNQRNELEADYYGTDLAYRLEQDVCAAVKFWKEMSERENQYSQLEDFFRTHPFSSLRAQCLQAHISRNFQQSCVQ